MINDIDFAIARGTENVSSFKDNENSSGYQSIHELQKTNDRGNEGYITIPQMMSHENKPEICHQDINQCKGNSSKSFTIHKYNCLISTK